MVGAHYGLPGLVQVMLNILIRPTSKRIYHEDASELTGKRGYGGGNGDQGSRWVRLTPIMLDVVNFGTRLPTPDSQPH